MRMYTFLLSSITCFVLVLLSLEYTVLDGFLNFLLFIAGLGLLLLFILENPTQHESRKSFDSPYRSIKF
jgi:hypothetical protein